MSAFRRLWEARACLREREVRSAGSVARRWDSAAAALRLYWAEGLARAWRARKRAWRSVVVGVEVEEGVGSGSAMAGGEGCAVSELCGSRCWMVVGDCADSGISVSSGAVVAATLRFFDGGIASYRRSCRT